MLSLQLDNRRWRTLADGDSASYMPFHGGNRGSNPLGDANNISGLLEGAHCFLAHFYR